MLPSISLCLLKDGNIPGNEGLLSEITDIYRITVTSVCNPIIMLLPVLCGIHVHDKDICIPPDVFLGRSDCVVGSIESASESNSCLQEIFGQSLSTAKSNHTLCQRYVPGSFIAYPENCVENPIIVDSSLLQSNEQLLLQVCEENQS